MTDFGDDITSIHTLEYGDEEDIEAGPVYYPPQLLVASINVVQGIIEGFTTAYTAVLLPEMDADLNAPFRVHDEFEAIVGAMMSLGQGTGALTAGLLTVYLGRIKLHAAMLLPTCLFWFMFAYPANKIALIIGRYLQGFTIGVRVTAGQLYAAEASHRQIRGAQTTMARIFMPFGILLVALLSKLMDWRGCCYFCCFFPLIIAPAYFFLPESPLWLQMKGRTSEAIDALTFLRGPEYDVLFEIDEVNSLLEQSAARKKGTIKDMFDIAYLKPISFCFFAITLRMLSGANVVMMFTRDIISDATPGGDSEGFDAGWKVAVVAAVQFVFAIVSAHFFEWLGRRKTAIGSALGMGIGLVGLGLSYYCKERPDSEGCYNISSFSLLPLLSILLFIACFSTGVSSVVFVLVAEMIPAAVKSVVSSMLFGYNSIFTFVVIMLYVPMRNSMHYFGVFWFYGSVCFALTAVFFFFLIETKGQSAVEIERRLTGVEEDPQRAAERKSQMLQRRLTRNSASKKASVGVDPKGREEEKVDDDYNA